MATKKSKAAMPATDKNMSVIDAAAKLLADAGEPLNCKTMIEQIAANGYWTSPGSRRRIGEGRFVVDATSSPDLCPARLLLLSSDGPSSHAHGTEGSGFG